MLLLTIRVQPRHVESGQKLTIDIHTAAGARLTVALEAPQQQTVVEGTRNKKGAKQGRHQVVQYRIIVRFQITVPASGRFTQAAQISYAMAKPVQARLRVTVQGRCGTATGSVGVQIDPPRHPIVKAPRKAPTRHRTGAPVVAITPTQLRFGAQTVGSAGIAWTVTVVNAGTATLTVGHIAVAGSNAADFLISKDLCSSMLLEPGAHCTISLRFGPYATGRRTAEVEIPDNARNSPQTMALFGTGVPRSAPVAAVIPVGIDFGAQRVGATTPAALISLSNTGGSPLTVGHATIVGANAGDFEVVNDSCSAATLAPRAHCTIGVRFRPGAAGLRTASLTLPDNAVDSPHVVDLSGIGKR